MRNRRFCLGLLVGLTLWGMMLTGAAGMEENETPTTLPGPGDWIRVDGQDHDLDEMLSLMRPSLAETLAIFSPPQRWKPFYDKIYGHVPIDLALYAAIYGLSPDGSEPPNLRDWPSFYQETKAEDEVTGQEQPATRVASLPGKLLDPPSSSTVTFKTRLFQQEEAKGSKANYTVIASLVLDQQQIFFLSLFQAGPDDSVELERLALDWRAEFLESLTQAEEEPSEQTLE